MLHHPFLNEEEFLPSSMWFIGVFDVYDREETLGAELGIYNPNVERKRAELIKRYSLHLNYLSYRHKFVLVKYLATKLGDELHDFQRYFDIDEDEAASWPRGEWYELNNPRDFFEHIYTLVQEVWKDELHKASVEDHSTW